jgi:NAD(P)-dependent dehydrogenase (short-subunit alcohol dehydrogenase family)
MMNDQTAVVTGASSGIGEAIARHLLDSGCRVITLQRKAPPLKHQRLTHYAVDLTNSAATAAAAAEIANRHTIGCLVNNAGANRPGPLEDATIDDLEYAVALNLRAAMQLIQAFTPGMRAAKFGRIVNISSRAALGKPYRMVYSATKAGLIGMSRTCALELGSDNITVNVVAPGPVATELFKRGHPAGSQQLQETIDSIVVKRVGTPDDIARAVMFFLSPDSGYITGQTLYVCGGASIGAAGV